MVQKTAIRDRHQRASRQTGRIPVRANRRFERAVGARLCAHRCEALRPAGRTGQQSESGTDHVSL